MEKIRLRWKKDPRPTGLSAVGAGPSSHRLHDGKTIYATIQALGGDWRGSLRGWFWYANLNGKYMNICNEARPLEVVKKEAMEWVKNNLKEAEKNA